MEVNMDIYSFIGSKDVAKHCRNIGHVFNPLEMAVIIGISGRPMAEVHVAWQELIDDYPDMTVLLYLEDFSQEDSSLHVEIRKAIAYEVANGCVDNESSEFNESSELLRSRNLISIPTPFKRGDVLTYSASFRKDFLTYSSSGHDSAHEKSIFVVDKFYQDEPWWPECEKKYKDSFGQQNRGMSFDMMAWGLFVNEEGVLYSAGAWHYDCFEYYHGELEGKDELLHYVSMYIKNERHACPQNILPLQCKVMFEYQLNDGLCVEGGESCILYNRLNSAEDLGGK